MKRTKYDGLTMNQWGLVGLLIGLLWLAALIWSTPARSQTQCSIERGSVKYLRDAGAAKIVWTPKLAAVSTLSKIPPTALTYSVRTPAEMYVYKLRVMFLLLKVESDGDLHVVVGDAYGRTMITEIPSPACVTNVHLPNLAATRALALTLKKGDKIEIVGVLYLDFAHGQTGHAPNYVELHPVISLKKL